MGAMKIFPLILNGTGQVFPGYFRDFSHVIIIRLQAANMTTDAAKQKIKQNELGTIKNLRKMLAQPHGGSQRKAVILASGSGLSLVSGIGFNKAQPDTKTQ